MVHLKHSSEEHFSFCPHRNSLIKEPHITTVGKDVQDKCLPHWPKNILVFMGTCFESESIKLLQLQIFCITLTAFLSSFMSFIILHHLYFKISHAPFKFICGSYYTGWQGGGGELSRITPIF